MKKLEIPLTEGYQPAVKNDNSQTRGYQPQNVSTQNGAAKKQPPRKP